MKHIVRKLFIDYEKEEKYLNEMAAKGLALTGYSWCKYVFQDSQKGEYIYRIELLENPINHPESQNYIKFMEETGIEFVASYIRWVYFRRKAADGDFDIYSDIDSRLKHFKRIRMLYLVLSLLNFAIGAMNIFNGYMQTKLGMIPINSYVAILSLVVGTLLLTLFVLPINKKITLLKKEKDIRE